MNTNTHSNPLNEDIKTLYNRASELARRTWDVIRDLPDHELRFIRDSLSKRFLSSKAERILVALDSLRRCEEAMGRLPGANRYDDFRKSHPQLELRSAKFIRNSFGASWSNAVATYHGESTANILRKRLTSSRSSYSNEDLLNYVREFIEQHSVEWVDGQPKIKCDDPELQIARRTIACLTQTGFRTYGRAQESLFRRRFPSFDLINARFGGWKNALSLAAEGIKDGELRVAVLESILSRDARREQLIALLRQFRAEHEKPPSREEFNEWLGTLSSRSGVDDLKAARAWIALRTSDDVSRSFRSWSQGLIAAGLIEPSFAQPGRIYATPEHRFSRNELIEWLCVARSEISGVMNDRSFAAWRSQRLSADESRPIPSARTIRHRFGSFASAIEAIGADLGAAA